MSYATLFDRIKVAAQFSAHVVEKDGVVVLYNRKRSLLLKGHDKVRLFSFIKNRTTLNSRSAIHGRSPDDLAPLVALLLQQNILEYSAPDLD